LITDEEYEEARKMEEKYAPIIKAWWEQEIAVRGALLTKFFSQFRRGDKLTYIGGSRHRHLTISKEYKIERRPWSEGEFKNWRISVKNDVGHVSALVSHHCFEETNNAAFEKWLKEN